MTAVRFFAVADLCAPWPYPQQAVCAYTRAMKAAMENEAARTLLLQVLADYEQDRTIDMRSVLAQIGSCAEACGEHPYTMQMLPYLCMLPEAREKYRREGLEDEMFLNTFSDLLRKTMECRRLHGIWGTFVAPWFYRFFCRECFAIGRLQFELAQFRGKRRLPEGAPVINVHIPSGAPLDYGACRQSYARAAAFFAPKLQTEGITPFVCDSWILHPINRGLDPACGLRRFAGDYELLFTIDDPTYGDMWIIFNKVWDGGVQELPEKTSLQRLYRAHLEKGGRVGRGYGLYQYQPR